MPLTFTVQGAGNASSAACDGAETPQDGGQDGGQDADQLRDHAWIAAHVPHQGSMCLLERVERWDAQALQCSAVSHRDAANPLRAFGRLGVACGIEYAAQAMAIHGALLAQRILPARAAPRAGLLASVRGVVPHVPRLDDIEDDLTVVVTRFGGDGNNVLYDFSISAGGVPVLDGRAAVILDSGNGLSAFMPAAAPRPAMPGAGLQAVTEAVTEDAIEDPAPELQNLVPDPRKPMP